MTDDSWSIDIPGLTEQRANEIRDMLLPTFQFGVHLVDPVAFFRFAGDAATMQVLVKCLEAGIAHADLPHEELMGALTMREDIQRWLDDTSLPEG